MGAEPMSFEVWSEQSVNGVGQNCIESVEGKA